MQTYELGFTSGAITGPLVAVTIIAATRPAMLLEFGVSTAAATVAGDVILGVPATTGTGSAGTAFQALNPSDPAASAHLVAGAFATTQPTAPANPFRRFGIPQPTAGVGIIWGWDPGELVIPTGGQVVLWAVAAAATFKGYAKVAEGG